MDGGPRGRKARAEGRLEPGRERAPCRQRVQGSSGYLAASRWRGAPR